MIKRNNILENKKISANGTEPFVESHVIDKAFTILTEESISFGYIC